MLEVGNGDIHDILQFPGDTEVIDDFVGLLNEGFVNVESFCGVRFGHFEVVFCQSANQS